MRLRELIVGLLNKAATGKKSVRYILSPLGILIFTCFVLLFVGASLRADKYLGLQDILTGSVFTITGLILMAAGIFFISWSIINFLMARGTPVPFNPPPKLVTSGPYRYIRNPMVTGLFIFLFGTGFYLSSVSSVLIFTPLFILLNMLELKLIEEPELEKRLGKEYTEYKNRVPMFFPRIRKG